MSEAKLPGISVVVTCYNCRDYIGDAIRSVARQTLRDFECVVVDDASTDDFGRGRAKHAGRSRRPALFADPPGQECRPDRRHAPRPGGDQGTFVCFLDSDDLWNPDFLERHLAAHLNESYAVGFTACNARLIDGQGKLIAGCVYWFGKERASADRDRAFAPIDPARVPRLDTAAGRPVAEADALPSLHQARGPLGVGQHLVDDVPPLADRLVFPER